MKNGKVIVILGMHRSGTSAIARCLDVFGISLGENLHPPAVDNPKGFWEDRDCLKINEELLDHLDSSYDRLGIAWNLSTQNPKIGALKNRAIELILHKLKTHNGLWGVKDPRTCRLLSFWQEVFRSAGCDAGYIIALRNPMNVASSLNKRNQIPFEKSYFLWLQHMLPAILQTEGSSRVFINFDSLLKEPAIQLARIASHLNLDIPDLNSDAVRSYVDDFLDLNLRHNSFSMAELESDTRAPWDTVVAYKLLISAAENSREPDDEKLAATARQIYDRLKQFSPVFDYANLLEKEQASLQAAISTKNSELNHIQQERTWLKQQVAAWESKASTAETHHAQLSAAMRDVQAEKTWLSEQLASHQALCAALDNELTAHKTQIDELRDANVWLTQQSAAWESKASTADTNYAQLASGMHDLQSEKAWLSEQLASHQALCAALDNELTAHKTQINKLRDANVWLTQQSAAWESKASTADTNYAQLASAMHDLQSEKTWLSEQLASHQALYAAVDKDLVAKNSRIDELQASNVGLTQRNESWASNSKIQTDEIDQHLLQIGEQKAHIANIEAALNTRIMRLLKVIRLSPFK